MRNFTFCFSLRAFEMTRHDLNSVRREGKIPRVMIVFLPYLDGFE